MILRIHRGFLLTSHGLRQTFLGLPAQRAPEIFSVVFCPTLPSGWEFFTDTNFFNQNFPCHAD